MAVGGVASSYLRMVEAFLEKFVERGLSSTRKNIFETAAREVESFGRRWRTGIIDMSLYLQRSGVFHEPLRLPQASSSESSTIFLKYSMEGPGTGESSSTRAVEEPVTRRIAVDATDSIGGSDGANNSERVGETESAEKLSNRSVLEDKVSNVVESSEVLDATVQKGRTLRAKKDDVEVADRSEDDGKSSIEDEEQNDEDVQEEETEEGTEEETEQETEEETEEEETEQETEQETDENE